MPRRVLNRKRKCPKSKSAAPLVLIEWEDSAQAAPQWQWLSEAEPPPILRCRSAGFLIRDTKKEKALAISIASASDGENAQVSGVIFIPARSVVWVYRLSVPSCLESSGREPASNSRRRAT